MIVTTFICDKCKRSQSNSDQFWKVEVRVAAVGCSYGTTREKSMQCCRPCTEALGMLPGDNAPQVTGAPEPTVEDLVREIVSRVTEK